MQFCLHLEFGIFKEDSHFRHARIDTDLPVEANHPPPPITEMIRGGEGLKGYQQTLVI